MITEAAWLELLGKMATFLNALIEGTNATHRTPVDRVCKVMDLSQFALIAAHLHAAHLHERRSGFQVMDLDKFEKELDELKLDKEEKKKRKDSFNTSEEELMAAAIALSLQPNPSSE